MKKVTQKQFNELLDNELTKAYWYSKSLSKSEYYEFIELQKQFLFQEYKIKK
jgi:hypothetical protein